MRGDDDTILNYAPMLRRIIILVAIITAVPVMLWTITAFMRTYVAQPTIPTARPMAMAAPPADHADAATEVPHPIVEARATATDARGPDIDGNPAPSDAKATAPASGMTASLGPPPMPAPQPSAAPSAASINPMAATGTMPWPTPAPPPQPTSAAPATVAEALPPPDPIVGRVPLPPHRPKFLALVTGEMPPAPAQATPAPAAAGPAAAASTPPPADQTAQPATAADTAADSLPPSDPIVGQVPLPRHRPNVLVLAEGGVPMPRARPALASEPAPSPAIEAPSSYEPGMAHY